MNKLFSLLASFTLLSFSFLRANEDPLQLDTIITQSQEIVDLNIDSGSKNALVAKEILTEEVIAFIEALKSSSIPQNEQNSILKALEFASLKHKDQYRKLKGNPPYLTHCIGVSMVLLKEGGITDATLIKAALLHDVLEKDFSSKEQIKEKFGSAVFDIVNELTLEPMLSQVDKKTEELRKSAKLSSSAKLIKLADRICNLRDLKNSAPSWSYERKRGYLLISEAMLKNLKGVHSHLESVYSDLVNEQLKGL